MIAKTGAQRYQSKNGKVPLFVFTVRCCAFCFLLPHHHKLLCVFLFCFLVSRRFAFLNQPVAQSVTPTRSLSLPHIDIHTLICTGYNNRLWFVSCSHHHQDLTVTTDICAANTTNIFSLLLLILCCSLVCSRARGLVRARGLCSSCVLVQCRMQKTVSPHTANI